MFLPKKGSHESWIINPLNLVGLSFLVIALFAVSIVITNPNSNFNPFSQAAKNNQGTGCGGHGYCSQGTHCQQGECVADAPKPKQNNNTGSECGNGLGGCSEGFACNNGYCVAKDQAHVSGSTSPSTCNGCTTDGLKWTWDSGQNKCIAKSDPSCAVGVANTNTGGDCTPNTNVCFSASLVKTCIASEPGKNYPHYVDGPTCNNNSCQNGVCTQGNATNGTATGGGTSSTSTNTSSTSQSTGPGACSSGQTRCNGTNAEVCSGNVWRVSQACTNGCTNGTCNSATSICNVSFISDLGCGKSPCKPNEDAQLWTNQSCGQSVRCINNNTCTLTGQTKTECIPNTSQCSGSTLQSCSASGVYVNQNCAYGCSSGKCNPVPTASTYLIPKPVSTPIPPYALYGQTVAQSKTQTQNPTPQYYGCHGALFGLDLGSWCDQYLNTTYNVGNTISFGTYSNYIKTYQNIAKENPQANYVQQAFNPEGVVASAKFGTVITVEGAIVLTGAATIPTAATAIYGLAGGSLAAIPTATYVYGTTLLATVPALQTAGSILTIGGTTYLWLDCMSSRDVTSQSCAMFAGAYQASPQAWDEAVQYLSEPAAGATRTVETAAAADLPELPSMQTIDLTWDEAAQKFVLPQKLTTNLAAPTLPAQSTLVAADNTIESALQAVGQTDVVASLARTEPIIVDPATSLAPTLNSEVGALTRLNNILNADNSAANLLNLDTTALTTEQAGLVAQLAGEETTVVAAIPEITAPNVEPQPSITEQISNAWNERVVNPINNLFKPPSQTSQITEIIPDTIPTLHQTEQVSPELLKKTSETIHPQVMDSLATQLEETGTIDGVTANFNSGRMWDVVYDKNAPGFVELKAKGGNAAVNELIDRLDSSIRQANPDFIFSPKTNNEDLVHITYPDITSDRITSIRRITDFSHDEASKIIADINAKYGVVNPSTTPSDYFWFGVGPETSIKFENIGGTLIQKVDDPIQGALLGLVGEDVPASLRGGDYLNILEYRGINTGDIQVPIPSKNITLEGNVLKFGENVGPEAPAFVAKVTPTDSQIEQIASSVGFDTSLTPKRIAGLLTPEQAKVLGSEEININLGEELVTKITAESGTTQIPLGEKIRASFDATPFSEVTTAIEQAKGAGSAESSGFAKIVSHYLEDIANLAKNNGGDTFKFAGDGAEMIFLDGVTPKALREMVDVSNSMNVNIENALNGEYGEDAQLAARFIEQNFKDKIFVKVGAVSTNTTLTIYEGSGKYIPIEVNTEIGTDNFLANSKIYKNINGVNTPVIGVSPELADKFTQEQLNSVGIKIIKDSNGNTFLTTTDSAPEQSIPENIQKYLNDVRSNISNFVQDRFPTIFKPTPTATEQEIQALTDEAGVIIPPEKPKLEIPFIQSPESKAAKYLTGYSMEEPEALVSKIRIDQQKILNDLGLPEPQLRRTNPQEYLDQVKIVANKMGIPIKSLDEIPPEFSDRAPANIRAFYDDAWGTNTVYVKNIESLAIEDLQRLGHEVVHGIDYKFNPNMPIEVKEYRAYVSEYNLSALTDKDGNPNKKLLNFIFGFSIGGSTEYYLAENGIKTLPWDLPVGEIPKSLPPTLTSEFAPIPNTPPSQQSFFNNYSFRDRVFLFSKIFSGSAIFGATLGEGFNLLAPDSVKEKVYGCFDDINACSKSVVSYWISRINIFNPVTKQPTNSNNTVNSTTQNIITNQDHAESQSQNQNVDEQKIAASINVNLGKTAVFDSPPDRLAALLTSSDPALTPIKIAYFLADATRNYTPTGNPTDGAAFEAYIIDKLKNSQYAYLLNVPQFQIALRRVGQGYGNTSPTEPIQCEFWGLLTQGIPGMENAANVDYKEFNPNVKVIFSVIDQLLSENPSTKNAATVEDSIRDNYAAIFPAGQNTAYHFTDATNIRPGDEYFIYTAGPIGHTGRILQIIDSPNGRVFVLSEANRNGDGQPNIFVVTASEFEKLVPLQNSIFLRDNNAIKNNEVPEIVNIPAPLATTNSDATSQTNDANPILAYANVGEGGKALPSTFIPPSLISVKNIKGVVESKDVYLNQSAADALANFAQYARSQGYTLYISDGYRSYDEQAQLHIENPTGAATAGNSEHQTGLAMDLYVVDANGNLKSLPGSLIAKAPDFGIIHPVAWDAPHFFAIAGLGIDTNSFNVIAKTDNDYLLLNQAIENAQNQANTNGN